MVKHQWHIGHTRRQHWLYRVVETIFQIDLGIFEDGDAVLADNGLIVRLFGFQGDLLFVFLVFFDFSELDVFDLPVLLLLLFSVLLVLVVVLLVWWFAVFYLFCGGRWRFGVVE